MVIEYQNYYELSEDYESACLELGVLYERLECTETQSDLKIRQKGVWESDSKQTGLSSYAFRYETEKGGLDLRLKNQDPPRNVSFLQSVAAMGFLIIENALVVQLVRCGTLIRA